MNPRLLSQEKTGIFFAYHESNVSDPANFFGWVPVFLWILPGGIFFGAVTDFGALYASVKNEGRSMGLLIEQYIGKTGKKLFLLFCWLFTLIVIAAFAVVFGLIQKKMHFTGWKDRFPQ